jgi:hypothetical protein
LTIYLFGFNKRTRFIATVAVLATAAMLLVVAPTQARAVNGDSTAVLAQGTGMVAKPSIRVRALQRALVGGGYSVGRSGIDGRFGPRTARAVRRFQSDRRLATDGIVGPRTRAALSRATRAVKANARRTHRAIEDRRAPRSDRLQRSASRPVHASARPTRVPASLALSSGPPLWRNPLLLGALAALLAAFGALALSNHRRRARAAAYRRSRFAPSRVGPATEALQSGEPPALLQGAVPSRDDPALVAAGEAGRTGASRPLLGLKARPPVIGYVTVQAEVNGRDVGRSERAIEEICERDGWRLVDIVRDSEGGPLLERSGMSRALKRIAGGEARGLVVSDARLLGRSIDLGELLRRLQAAEAALVAIDLGLDTSTVQGRRVASALITIGGWGRPPDRDPASRWPTRDPGRQAGHRSPDVNDVRELLAPMNGYVR